MTRGGPGSGNGSPEAKAAHLFNLILANGLHISPIGHMVKAPTNF